MKSDFEPKNVRRNASGSIDMHYYEQKAHEERSCALRAIGRSLIKQVRAITVKRQKTMVTDRAGHCARPAQDVVSRWHHTGDCCSPVLDGEADRPGSQSTRFAREADSAVTPGQSHPLPRCGGSEPPASHTGNAGEAGQGNKAKARDKVQEQSPVGPRASMSCTSHPSGSRR